MLYLISSNLTSEDVQAVQEYLSIAPLSCVVLSRADERLHSLAQQFGVPVLLSDHALLDASKLSREAPVALMDDYQEKLSVVDGDEAHKLL